MWQVVQKMRFVIFIETLVTSWVLPVAFNFLKELFRNNLTISAKKIFFYFNFYRRGLNITHSTRYQIWKNSFKDKQNNVKRPSETSAFRVKERPGVNLQSSYFGNRILEWCGFSTSWICHSIHGWIGWPPVIRHKRGTWLNPEI